MSLFALLQPLPNISKIREFMEIKAAYQDRAVSFLHSEIESYYAEVENDLKQKHDSAQSLLKTLTEKYGDYAKSAEAVKEDVKEVQGRLDGVRHPAPNLLIPTRIRYLNRNMLRNYPRRVL